MMRILMALSLISLTFSCAHKDAGKSLLKSSGRDTRQATEPAESGHAHFDSTFYIGYVDYFPDTREFYTALFYRDGYEYPDEDLLESKLDSVIVFEEDWGRERLPIAEAKKFLVLFGLDTISVFNRKHELLCKSPLTRVEYLWNGLESYFIAVFKADDSFAGQTEELYGIGSGLPLDQFSGFASHEISDAKLNDYLIRKLEISRAHGWNMRHYRLAPSDATYSIISSSDEASESRSYLTVLSENQVEVLNEEFENYHYLNILPIPVQMNGRPLLLISAGYPSSDVLWDYLAGYNGTRYEALDYNRIHLNHIVPNWSGRLSDAAQVNK